MRRADRLAWLLIAAVALAASACGHALELVLENMRWFGDGRAAYAHPAQVFELDLAGALFIIAAVAIGRKVVSCALGARSSDDCFVPALDGVCRIGMSRCAALLLIVQFGALIASELLEQRLSGSPVGLTSILGAGHLTAVAVHTTIGLLFGFALYRFASFIRRQSSALAGAIALFVRRAAPPVPICATPLPQFCLWTSLRKPPLLALGLANRPPPASALIA